MQNFNHSIESAIVEKLKPLNPLRIILFGSYAYGTPDVNSDLDICVIKKAVESKSKERKEIREKLNPIHIDFVNKSKDEKLEQEATKFEQDIMENGQISNDDVKQVVKEVIKERVKDEKEMALTFDLADEIYQETVGK